MDSKKNLKIAFTLESELYIKFALPKIEILLSFTTKVERIKRNINNFLSMKKNPTPLNPNIEESLNRYMNQTIVVLKTEPVYLICGTEKFEFNFDDELLIDAKRLDKFLSTQKYESYTGIDNTILPIDIIIEKSLTNRLEFPESATKELIEALEIGFMSKGRTLDVRFIKDK